MTREQGIIFLLCEIWILSKAIAVFVLVKKEQARPKYKMLFKILSKLISIFAQSVSFMMEFLFFKQFFRPETALWITTGDSFFGIIFETIKNYQDNQDEDRQDRLEA